MSSNYPLFRAASFLIIAVFVISPGCKGGAQSPTDLAGTSVLKDSVGSSGIYSSGNRVLCSLWDCSIDAATGEVEAAPLREVSFHVNVVDFVNTSGEIGFKPVSADPQNGKFTFDITLHHPLPYAVYRGHDVRGIVFGPGEELMGSKADPDLTWISPGGFHVLNADGYTRWWNPKEFTTEGIYGYTSGIYGSNGFPPDVGKSATLNPYKYFAPAIGANDPVIPGVLETRGEFPSGSKATRRYELLFPVVSGNPDLRFQYAIDAAWGPPAGANCREAFHIDVKITKDTLWYYSEIAHGGELGLSIEVFDWGAKDNPEGIAGEILTLGIQSPTLFDFEEIISSPPSPGTTEYSGIYIFSDFSEGLHPTCAEGQEILISVTASGPLSYKPPSDGPAYPIGKNLSAYAVIEIPVENISDDLIIKDVTPPGLNFMSNAVCENNGLLYIAAAYRGLIILDNTDPSNPEVVRTIPTALDYSYLEPVDVDLAAGYAYVTDYYSGLSIVDIDPPESAYLVSAFCQGEGDLRLCTSIDGNYLYVGFKNNKIQVYDISTPNSPIGINTIWTDDAVGGVKVAGDYVYAATGEAGLSVIDNEDPWSGSIVLKVNTPGYAMDVDTMENMAYIADDSGGVQIIDISEPESAYSLGSLDTPDNALRVGFKDGYAYVAGSTEGIHIIDAYVPELPLVVKTVPGLSNATCLDLTEGKANVCSKSLNVIDSEIPEDAYIAYSVGLPSAYRLATTDSTSYVYAEGSLYAIDSAVPGAGHVVKKVGITKPVSDIAADNGYVYLAGAIDGGVILQIVDVDPLASASVIKTLNFPKGYANAAKIAASNGYVYLIDDDYYFRVIDVSPPESAGQVTFLEETGGYKAVSVPNGSMYAYIVTTSDIVRIIDIDPPESSNEVSSVNLNQDIYDMTCDGEYVYSIGYSYGPGETTMTIIDINPWNDSHIVNDIPVQDDVLWITSSAGYAYILADKYFYIYDISPPESAKWIAAEDLPYDISNDISVYSNHIYVANDMGGMIMFEIG